jgi:hypothetical protein
MMGAFETRLAAGYRAAANCTTCLGLGCNDCCHTGAGAKEYEPRAERERWYRAVADRDSVLASLVWGDLYDAEPEPAA